ncbi:FAD-binding monooxygenase, partial [Streptomyces sp. T-3]|nr:FAD-binding monooxygenase [Streptomyces sp. T-3]
KALLGRGGAVATFARARAAALVTRTPIGLRITQKIAYGTDPVEVRTDLFEASRPEPARS